MQAWLVGSWIEIAVETWYRMTVAMFWASKAA
jgi:hypothetical protein